ncbi:MAG: 2-hydroxyacyl-CoA dehydratase family protein, partial [Smithellaceae bacterium]|nr:2-hydroxyacyl-CoA dehydratase family protein [Smithellaceae bacterium]
RLSNDNFRNSASLYRQLRGALLEMEKESARGALSFADYCRLVQRLVLMPVEDAVTEAEAELNALRMKPDVAGGIGVIVSGILAPSAALIRAMEDGGLTVCGNDVASLHRSFAHTPASYSAPEDYYQAFYEDHFPCPTLLHTADGRLGALLALIRERKARGVIFVGEKFCEYEYFEFPYLERELNEAGIATLTLELALGDEDAGALKTRIEAFAEILARR